MFQALTLTVLLAAGGHAHKEPTPPAPPSAPEAPKVAAPEAPHKQEAPAKGGQAGTAKDAKGEAGKSSDAPKGDAHKAPAPKGEAPKGEAKAAGKTEEPASKPVRRGVRDRQNIPPSLTGNALRQEVRQNGGEDRTAPMSERQRLEQLAAEINKAREALKQDTARLESMLKGGDGSMPVGDPSATVPTVAAGAAASKEAMKEQILSVSKAMKGMKPEQAGAIIGRLDRVLAAEILRRMKPADAGAVMGAIKPEVAAELTTLIATRKSLIDEKKEVRQ